MITTVCAQPMIMGPRTHNKTHLSHSPARKWAGSTGQWDRHLKTVKGESHTSYEKESHNEKLSSERTGR